MSLFARLVTSWTDEAVLLQASGFEGTVETAGALGAGVDEHGDFDVAPEEGDEGGDVACSACGQDAPVVVQSGAAVVGGASTDEVEVQQVAGAFHEEVGFADEQVLGDVVAQRCLEWEEAVLADAESLLRDDGSLLGSLVFDDPDSVEVLALHHEGLWVV